MMRKLDSIFSDDAVNFKCIKLHAKFNNEMTFGLA